MVDNIRPRLKYATGPGKTLACWSQKVKLTHSQKDCAQASLAITVAELGRKDPASQDAPEGDHLDAMDSEV